MSGISSIFKLGSSSSSDKQATTTTSTTMNTQQKSSSDPETASVASFSSTAALFKSEKSKQQPAVDAKKLQEQALKSQKPTAWNPPAAFRF